jgi:RNA polymerase sigma-70 factor (ECF subfamily)
LRRQRRLLSDGDDREALAASVPAPGQLPPEELEKYQATRVIYEVLDRMNERNRSLIVLFELEEMSGLEIAELKGVKVGTVWVWLHRARADFRRRLAEIQGHRRTGVYLPSKHP